MSYSPETLDSLRVAGWPSRGWYRDPYGEDGLRWWDGEQWSSEVRQNAIQVPQQGGRPYVPESASMPGAVAGVAYYDTGADRRKILMALVVLAAVIAWVAVVIATHGFGAGSTQLVAHHAQSNYAR